MPKRRSRRLYEYGPCGPAARRLCRRGEANDCMAPVDPLPDAFVSSCYVDHARNAVRLATLVEMCLSSACSFREWHPSRNSPFIYFVSSKVPKDARHILAKLADAVKDLPSPRWPKGAGPEPDSARLYSFLKLDLWKLTSYSRILYWDADLFWSGDAQRYFDRYGAAPHLAAAEYRHPGIVPRFWRLVAKRRYINSGVLLLRPSLRTHASLMRRWRTRNFTSEDLPHPSSTLHYKGRRHLGGQLQSNRPKLSEQDIVRAEFEDTLTPMDSCDNFRGYVKPSADGQPGGQSACDPANVIAWHGARFQAKASCTRSLGSATWTRQQAQRSIAPLPASFVAWERSWTRGT